MYFFILGESGEQCETISDGYYCETDYLNESLNAIHIHDDDENENHT